MSKELVDQAITDAENLGFMAYSKRPVSSEDIAKCEESMGYVFSESYKHFLNVCGFAGIAGTELYGLIPNDLNSPSHLNAYNFNTEMHEDFAFPQELFAFEDFEGDAVACLLMSRMVNDECPVILWDHSESFDRQLKKPHVLAPSFGEYLLEKTKQAIELKRSDNRD